jgi:anti-sigma factor RsiW
MTNHELQLMAYVDGELDAETMRAVEALLAVDAEARRTVEKFRDASALLRAACAEGFYAGGAARLPPAPIRPVRAALRRFAGYAAVAVVAVFVGFGGGLVSSRWTTSDHQRLINEVAEYHAVQSQETKHLVEVPASEAADLTTWLGRRLQRHLAIPDLTPAGLHFAGGRMVVIDRTPAAALIYTRDNGPPVAICIIHTGGAATGLRIDRRGAQNLASWADGTYTYVVAGDLTPAEAQAIAESAAPQLRL